MYGVEAQLPVVGIDRSEGPHTFPCGECSNLSIIAPNSAERQRTGGDTLLPAPEHVLSTLERDGSRRWMRPKLSTGNWWRRRRMVAYVLMVMFVVVPHISIGGQPLIRLDIAAHKFTILGRTFLPTDTLLLALVMLAAFVSIVFITAVTGRAWCGWACPQTVYMEFLFRPIDRWFDGTAGKGGRPKASKSVVRHLARFTVYLLLTMFLAHTFLAYFVGPEKLAVWMRSTPWQHPQGFLVMAVTTALLLYDFLFFREQTCMIACPYGRFQSVMLDQQSLIVAYDYTRGEPRKKGKHRPNDDAGDCVDCHQCVVVCPTGIDIRNGLQMECINCTQCIDACDQVMERVGLPKGLILYSSQDTLAKKPRRLLRARTIIYPVLLIGVVIGLVFAVSSKYGFDARIIRGKGNPFSSVGRGIISNTFALRLVNRTGETQIYSLSIVTPEEAKLEVIDESALQLQPGDTSMVPLNVRFPTSLTFGDGNEPVKLRVNDASHNSHLVDFRILGPRQ